MLALLAAVALPVGAYDFYANGLYFNETNNSYGGYFHSVVTYGPVKYHGNKTIPRGVWLNIMATKQYPEAFGRQTTPGVWWTLLVMMHLETVIN